MATLHPGGLTREHVVWAYRLLLDRDPENEDVIGPKLAGSRDTRDLRQHLMTSAEFQTQASDANGAKRGQDLLRFPDVTLDFGRVPSVLLLEHLLKNPRLRSSANRQVTTEYNATRGDKTSRTRLVQFHPLLGISGDLPNGMRLELNTEHRHSDRELFQLGSSLQQDINTDMDLSLSRSYSAGQKVTFFGRESTVRSSVSLGITGRYERQTGRILQSGIARNPTSTDRLSVNANGSYGFSNAVSGNATLGFSQDRNKLTAIVHRSLRVELSARFSL